MIESRDYLKTDTSFDYAITHYVGYTTQQPPMKRVKQHGSMCADHLVLVRQGNEDDEIKMKAFESCPKCRLWLWYYEESPTYTAGMTPKEIRDFRDMHQRWNDYLLTGIGDPPDLD